MPKIHTREHFNWGWIAILEAEPKINLGAQANSEAEALDLLKKQIEAISKVDFEAAKQGYDEWHAKGVELKRKRFAQ